MAMAIEELIPLAPAPCPVCLSERVVDVMVLSQRLHHCKSCGNYYDGDNCVEPHED